MRHRLTRMKSKPCRADDLQMCVDGNSFRGSKGALTINPREWEPEELERITRRFTQEFGETQSHQPIAECTRAGHGYQRT
ncbi:MAG: hypothetical protein CM1200mP41_25520 [Gammaproteobacteria bacterium]|nr:MAG: hypothetical protein CM1200mP41_25520 [Gammaproteobacteria bacterium]